MSMTMTLMIGMKMTTGMRTENPKTRLHAYISGRVQGVSFRYYTLHTAKNLRLTGWVRNLWDGRVEVLAEGDLENLTLFLRWLRKGPTSAVVNHVDYSFNGANGEIDQFQVRPTA